MAQKVMLNVPLNRVEGDLEVRAEISAGNVSDAWCGATTYRGFEKILLGRGALDGLAITPRVCGICTTGHLTAATLALDAISGANPPPDALRIRNLALMTEHIQSDMRHAFLMFSADFTNPAYQHLDLYPEALRRYQPFKGETALQTIRATKAVLGMVAIIGGQWPHSSYMVPGGVVSNPSPSEALECRLLLEQYRRWYEERVLGCSLERWLEVRSGADLDAWLEETASQNHSDLAFFIRFARAIGLDKMGVGHNCFLSYGALPLPESTRVKSPKNGGRKGRLVPAGFAQASHVREFNQEKIAEHVGYSWYEDYEGGRHPFDGQTSPYATGQESLKYSWAKAPRYDGLPAETGPLAEMIISGNPLFTDLLKRSGPSAFLRELARLTRPATLFPAMEIWLDEVSGAEHFYNPPGEITQGQGFGATHASRGALGHWVKIEGGAISHYQIITPTGWNASPRDSNGIRGPLEEALIGTEIKDPDNPVELGHVARSFDCCLVCTVHAVNNRQNPRRT